MAPLTSEPRVPVKCAETCCARTLYVEHDHADNLRSVWRCDNHQESK